MENETNYTVFFDAKTLQILADFESQFLKGITYTYWVNRVDAKNPIKLLQYITFTFIDDTKIMIGANDDMNAIEISHANIITIQNELKQQFDDKILLLSTDATQQVHWQTAIAYPIAQVVFEHDGTGKYYSDCLTLDFSLHTATISVTEMGLHIDFESPNS
jgi:hypothetical protein